MHTNSRSGIAEKKLAAHTCDAHQSIVRGLGSVYAGRERREDAYTTGSGACSRTPRPRGQDAVVGRSRRGMGITARVRQPQGIA